MNDTHSNAAAGVFRGPSRRPGDADLSQSGHRELVDSIEGDCVSTILRRQSYWICELASSLSTLQIDQVDPPYGWTIRQVFAHCADAERIFGDRMLRLAAGDTTDLPTWDQDAYAATRFGLGNFTHIVTELGYLREANSLLLGRIGPRVWDNRGTVGGNPITVRGVAWVTAAHLAHHLRIVQKRAGVEIVLPAGP